jgi:hypothetical protein
MVATKNATLTKLKSGRLALGLIVKLHSGVEMAKIAKACDHDFLFIDMQHGEMSVEAIVALCHASLDTGVTPLRGLDNGAMGSSHRTLRLPTTRAYLSRTAALLRLGRALSAQGIRNLNMAPTALAWS